MRHGCDKHYPFSGLALSSVVSDRVCLSVDDEMTSGLIQ